MNANRFRFSWSVARWVLFIGLALFMTYTVAVAQEKEDAEEDDGDQPWNATAGTKYLSRYTTYGIDLSQNRSAISFQGEISHEIGLSVGAEAFTMLGTDGGYEQSSFHLGYERPVTKSITLSGVFTHHSYKNDSLNVLAGISSTFTFGGTLQLKGVTIGASYSVFFGGGSANYVETSVSTNRQIGQLTLAPMLQACFASQTVDQRLLPKNRGKGLGRKNQQGTGAALTTTITGLSSLSLLIPLSYPLGRGFTVTLTPSYVYSPTDLAATTAQFVWYGGLSYSADF